jgi:hypothetical protein
MLLPLLTPLESSNLTYYMVCLVMFNIVGMNTSFR